MLEPTSLIRLIKGFRSMPVIKGDDYANGQAGGYRLAADELEVWFLKLLNSLHESNLNSGAKSWIKKTLSGTVNGN